MTRAPYLCHDRTMSAPEPKDRLRQARTRLGLSRAQLAAKLGKSQSMIRAHENGQNSIQPEIAASYARELGVSPAWILYGSDDEVPVTKQPPGRVVEVVGEIWDKTHFIPEDELFEPDEEGRQVTLSLPDWEDVALIAFAMRGDQYSNRNRKFVIVASLPLSELTLVDEVVLIEQEGRLVQTGIWRVGAPEPGWRIYYQGKNQASAVRLLKVRPGDEDAVVVVGPVVGEISVRKRVIWPEHLAEPEDVADDAPD